MESVSCNELDSIRHTPFLPPSLPTYLPPAAPPLIPNVGPCDGCRMQTNVFLFKWAPRAWHRPTVVVLLPSPSGVGLMPVMTT
jgi:hypothetical protein